MVSQTLEILRQGVWASLTGGWFYDPQQDVFCNTFHLYLWLFLLCFPFSIYIYCPNSMYVWHIYCITITAVFSAIKIINFSLHRMYDTTECIEIEPDLTAKIDATTECPISNDEGIEMQVLSKKDLSESSPAIAAGCSLNLGSTDIDSIDSIDFQKTDQSATSNFKIDLKVDVHRKNSSGSSEEAGVTVPTRTSKIDQAENANELDSQTNGQNGAKISPKNPQKPKKGSNQADSHDYDANVPVDECQLHRKFVHLHESDCTSLDCLVMDALVSHSTPKEDSKEPSTSANRRTGSVDFSYPEKTRGRNSTKINMKNPNSSVRRIKSTASCSTVSQPVGILIGKGHPNSMEIIGVPYESSDDVFSIVPVSTSRGKMNTGAFTGRGTSSSTHGMCPYYSASEIVYSIAEQSDEHQNSHGADTDIESLNGSNVKNKSETLGDSDDERNAGSRSPLLTRTKIDPTPEKRIKNQSLAKNGENELLISPTTCNVYFRENTPPVDCEAAITPDTNDNKEPSDGTSKKRNKFVPEKKTLSKRSKDYYDKSKNKNNILNTTLNPNFEREMCISKPEITSKDLEEYDKPVSAKAMSTTASVGGMELKNYDNLKKYDNLDSSSIFLSSKESFDNSAKIAKKLLANKELLAYSSPEMNTFVDVLNADVLNADVLVDEFGEYVEMKPITIAVVCDGKKQQQTHDDNIKALYKCDSEDSDSLCQNKSQHIRKQEVKVRNRKRRLAKRRVIAKKQSSSTSNESLAGLSNLFDCQTDAELNPDTEVVKIVKPENETQVSTLEKNENEANESNQNSLNPSTYGQSAKLARNSGAIPKQRVTKTMHKRRASDQDYHRYRHDELDERNGPRRSSSGSKRCNERSDRFYVTDVARQSNVDSGNTTNPNARQRFIELPLENLSKSKRRTHYHERMHPLNRSANSYHQNVCGVNYGASHLDFESGRFPCRRTLSRENSSRSLHFRRRNSNNNYDAHSSNTSNCSSNNELNTLLPSPLVPIWAAFYDKRSTLGQSGPPGIYSQRQNSQVHPQFITSQPQTAVLELSISNPQTPQSVTSFASNRLKRSMRMTRRMRYVPLACQVATSSNVSNSSSNSVTVPVAASSDAPTGSFHYYYDDNGTMFARQTDDKSTGPSIPVTVSSTNNRLFHSLWRQHYNQSGLSDTMWPTSTMDSCNDIVSNGSLSSGLTVILDSPVDGEQIDFTSLYILDVNNKTHQRSESSTGAGTTMYHLNSSSSQYEIVEANNLRGTTQRRERGFGKFLNALDQDKELFPRAKHYYKYQIWRGMYVRVEVDRIDLISLLDRNGTMMEMFLTIFIVLCVSYLGAILLHNGYYRDLNALVFCFVMAGCQYSLLKSVQPDASSPVHGFNKLTVFSRSVYFCLFALLINLLNLLVFSETFNNFVIYGFNVFDKSVYLFLRNNLLNFLLYFPAIFLLGLLPQINTFLLYLLEQIDMNINGGTAMTSLAAAVFAVFRSFFAVLLLFGFMYGALYEEKGSQHILFSMFCALLVCTSYHLSRSSSDPMNLWNILKIHLWPPELMIYHEERSKNQINTVLNESNKVNVTNQSQNSKLKNSDKNKPTTSDDKTEKSAKAARKKIKQPKTKKTKDNTTRMSETGELKDPLPEKLQTTVYLRLKNDMLICSLIAVIVFGLHYTNVLASVKMELCDAFRIFLVVFGFVIHYAMPQMRKQLPWLCVARPILRTHEYGYYEVNSPAKIMCFERLYVYLNFIERNIFYPLLFLLILTQDMKIIHGRFGTLASSIIITVAGLKLLRNAYCEQNCQYLILVFTMLFFKWDLATISESFLIDYYVVSIVYKRLYELLLKLQFVVTYIAPWQLTWGSSFHAFAQPFSVPHSAILFLQTIISALMSAPLNPFLGSALFLTSYVRPIKFWERDYNTKRVDHSNTRLSSHLERNLGGDDNNLNSIFYEHLSRSLQHSLCGDLYLGRWGLVNQGDCFVMASDYLNCLVHIIEMGNGLVTFQMRGLEFRGTYCQQREVEAISEDVERNDGCCCCEPGHLPHMLSVNKAFNQRWLAWEVTSGKYVLEGYSISDNSAVSMLQVFDFRKVLVTYYVKSIIYYVLKSPKLIDWLKNQAIFDALSLLNAKNFIDLDPVFNLYIDEDFDCRSAGITKASFCNVYYDWIQYCAAKRDSAFECSRDSKLVLFCFALSLLGRRTLGTASHNTVSSVEFFLYGLHALFKGDFRITSTRDEWIFNDIEILRLIVAPAVRMSLKLHQDHFNDPDETDELDVLYQAIGEHEKHLVISHEGDPAWRTAVLSGTPSLLALRHVLEEGTDEYKVIMLNKRYLSFRIIKINRECVRGLWSGQQQELIFLRNRNPERGSIQNARQALRNIINSSCDQPIGYPIYVSPLITSYADTNEQLSSIVGSAITFSVIKNKIINLWKCLRQRFDDSCLSGGSAGRNIEEGFGNEGIYAMNTYPMHTYVHSTSSHIADTNRSGSLGRSSMGANRGSSMSVSKQTANTTLVNLAGLLNERRDKRDDLTDKENNDLKLSDDQTRVKIIDPEVVYDAINLGRRIDVVWPDEKMRLHGGRSYWKDWLPETDMEGTIVHKWLPCHRDPNRRSHVDKTILLLKIDDKYVPIAESGVIYVHKDTENCDDGGSIV